MGKEDVLVHPDLPGVKRLKTSEKSAYPQIFAGKWYKNAIKSAFCGGLGQNLRLIQYPPTPLKSDPFPIYGWDAQKGMLGKLDISRGTLTEVWQYVVKLDPLSIGPWHWQGHAERRAMEGGRQKVVAGGFVMVVAVGVHADGVAMVPRRLAGVVAEPAYWRLVPVLLAPR